jgi:hypothetical protein
LRIEIACAPQSNNLSGPTHSEQGLRNGEALTWPQPSVDIECVDEMAERECQWWPRDVTISKLSSVSNTLTAIFGYI